MPSSISSISPVSISSRSRLFWDCLDSATGDLKIGGCVKSPRMQHGKLITIRRNLVSQNQRVEGDVTFVLFFHRNLMPCVRLTSVQRDVVIDPHLEVHGIAQSRKSGSVQLFTLPRKSLSAVLTHLSFCALICALSRGELFSLTTSSLSIGHDGATLSTVSCAERGNDLGCLYTISQGSMPQIWVLPYPETTQCARAQ